MHARAPRARLRRNTLPYHHHARSSASDPRTDLRHDRRLYTRTLNRKMAPKTPTKGGDNQLSPEQLEEIKEAFNVRAARTDTHARHWLRVPCMH